MMRAMQLAAVCAMTGLCATVLAAPTASSPTPTTALHAARWVDVEAGRLMTDAWIVVRGDRIAAIGPRSVVPADAQLIELGDSTLVPGLIDCHTHVADMPDVADPYETLRYSPAEIAYAAIPNARATLQAGFTTVRDVGTYRAFNDVALRDAIAKGLVEGPRMYVAGAYLTITGGAGAMTGLASDIPLPPSLH